ncbi:PREDICTED: uncharacterized protein LOC105977277 [Erythranthe guttata]|uniref:uncharacterized protein LOC105977277 n=1 Tax=Erythranthe guttata TaxID=4155 RepID=UPI00064D963E|nr:PREDICTED: uncharacterized protein LOC105977277 [Erythranthe guttata]|eukprot:XP_012858039.1 PREDICTED: uncharacterized protein LOC105977277 [Erythranthe guttata]
MVPSPICMRCGADVETFLHVLQECNQMGKIWSSPFFNLRPMRPQSSMWNWISLARAFLQRDKLLLALIIAWKAWDVRNKLMHREEAMEAKYLITWGQDFLIEFQKAMVLTPEIQTRSLSTAWSPPPEGCIKINVDAALPKGMVYYSVAMVARDWRGGCCRWAVRRFPRQPQPVECEAHAVFEAISCARTVGWSSIIIEGDCLQVISSLKEGESSLSSFGAYIDECLAITGSFIFCDFSFVKRSGNQLAHVFATNISLSCSDGTHIPHNLAINV